jgi:hypothetical protein
VGIGHPFGGADGIALDQAVDDLGPAGKRGSVYDTSLSQLYAL